MSLLPHFNKRKFFYFGKDKKCIALEISGFDSSPSISLTVNGDEGEVTFHIGLWIAFYVTFTDFLPNSWYPQDKSETYGYLPGERRISLTLFNWSLQWCFWKDDSVWTKGDSRFRSGSFDFVRLLKGKHSCRWEELEKENYTISMLEGNYSVEVIKNKRIDSWSRWFTRNSVSYEVKAGYYNDKKEWINCPIPVEGKGESSWDCGENATYSSSFPAKNDYHDIRNCLQAALYFEQNVKKDRVKYGGKNWLPKAHKKEGIKLILN